MNQMMTNSFSMNNQSSQTSQNYPGSNFNFLNFQNIPNFQTQNHQNNPLFFPITQMKMMKRIQYDVKDTTVALNLTDSLSQNSDKESQILD